MTQPIPNAEGHWWGKLIHPEQPAGEDFASVDWEVMQVFENDLSGTTPVTRFRVFVPGIEKSQRLDAFIWGPAVPQPKELS